MHNKEIVLCLVNVAFTTSKFLHGNYEAIFERLGTQEQQIRLCTSPLKCTDPQKAEARQT